MTAASLDRPMNLAVIFEQESQAGGGYHQAITACLLARKLPADLCRVQFYSTLPSGVAALAAHGIDAHLLRLGAVSRQEIKAWATLGSTQIGSKWLRRLRGAPPLEKRFSTSGTDLVYFTSPSPLARGLGKLNYMTTIWDIAHRDEPEFPEIREPGISEGRERLYRDASAKACGIFVDSAMGKDRLIELYGAAADRIHILPFAPSPSVANDLVIAPGEPLASMYNIDFEYVFYPANFWSHKNHVYILQALKLIAEQRPGRLGAVFCGADKGNQSYVEKVARLLGVADRVRFLGLVDDAELPGLYRSALALVMPSYFGPTNIPPLEAFHLGVPVIYSDKKGFREQVGEAALLVDLEDPGTLARAIVRLQDEGSLRVHLVSAGKSQLASLASDDRLGTLAAAVRRFKTRRLCWE